MAVHMIGAPVATAICEENKKKSDALRAKGIIPTLAIVRIGERGGDLAYEKSATKRCGDSGVEVVNRVFPEDVTEETFLAAIREISADPAIHGCLIFRPLPRHISDMKVAQALGPAKDVDGSTDLSLAGVFAGTDTGFAPCTAQACIEILKHYEVPVSGKHAVVLGRSLVIGRPVAMMLMHQNATVTICHSRTENIREFTKNADIIIAATGKADMVDESYLGEGQTIIDVGVTPVADGSLHGDVQAAAAEAKAARVTMFEDRIGSVTASVLVKHVIEAAEAAC